jgi:two-component system nitrate/nitrite response regulator NarL
MTTTMRSAQPIRVAVIAGHAVIRAGLRGLIESRGIVVVGEAGNDADALSLAASEQPDVILLDLESCAKNGNWLKLFRGLRAVACQARVLFLSDVRDLEQQRHAVRQGGRGVVLKDQAPEVLHTAIEKVHAGDVWLNRGTLPGALS